MDGESPNSAKELNIIEQNVRMCRDLLTMWQSYGSVEAAPHKSISVSAILRDVVKGIGPMAAQSGVSLSSEICELPGVLLGDGLQVQRALQNVVINAVQAASETKGAVSVVCEQKGFLHRRSSGGWRHWHDA